MVISYETNFITCLSDAYKELNVLEMKDFEHFLSLASLKIQHILYIFYGTSF